MKIIIEKKQFNSFQKNTTMHNSSSSFHFKKSQGIKQYSISDRKQEKGPYTRMSPYKNLHHSTSQEKFQNDFQNPKFSSPYSSHIRVQSDLSGYYTIDGKENEIKRFEYRDKETKLQEQIGRLEERVRIAEKKAERANNLFLKFEEMRLKIENIEKYVCSMHKKKDSGEGRSLGVKIKGATGAYIDQFETMNKYIKNEIEKLQKEVDKKLQASLSEFSTSLRSDQFFKTNRKYSNTPITLIYQQWIKNSQKSDEKHRINKVIYYMDHQGYLMDQESFYLVNRKGEKIKLGNKEISLLQKIKILH